MKTKTINVEDNTMNTTLKEQLDEFLDRAKLDDLNTVIEEAKRRFIQKGLE